MTGVHARNSKLQVVFLQFVYCILINSTLFWKNGTRRNAHQMITSHYPPRFPKRTYKGTSWCRGAWHDSRFRKFGKRCKRFWLLFRLGTCILAYLLEFRPQLSPNAVFGGWRTPAYSSVLGYTWICLSLQSIKIWESYNGWSFDKIFLKLADLISDVLTRRLIAVPFE